MFDEIDALVPIGRGQRQLFLGDRGTGKSTISLDTILSNRWLNEEADRHSMMYFVYVSNGLK